MKRLSILLLPMLVWLASAGSAAAQVNLQVVRLNGPGGDRDTNMEIQLGFNAADCDSDTAAITVEPANNTMLTVSQADVWLGSDSCAASTTRNGADQSCDYISSPTIDGTSGAFDILLSQLRDAGRTQVCDGTAVQGTDYTITVLLRGMSMDIGDVGSEYGTISIKVDAVAPVAPVVPESARSLRGDTQVAVSWDRITNDQNVVYQVIDGGDCGSGTMGEVLATTGQNAESQGINPDTDLNLAYGAMGAVYVRAEDQAGNVGEVSEEICIERIPVTGFCDVYEEMGGTDCEDNCSVSAAGLSRGRGHGMWFVALTAMALVWRRRR